MRSAATGDSQTKNNWPSAVNQRKSKSM